MLVEGRWALILEGTSISQEYVHSSRHRPVCAFRDVGADEEWDGTDRAKWFEEYRQKWSR